MDNILAPRITRLQESLFTRGFLGLMVWCIMILPKKDSRGKALPLPNRYNKSPR